MKKHILFLVLSYTTIGFSQKTDSYKLTKQEIIQKELDQLSDFPIYKAF